MDFQCQGNGFSEPKIITKTEGDLLRIPRNAIKLLKGLLTKRYWLKQKQLLGAMYLFMYSAMKKGGEGKLSFIQSNRYK